MFVLFLEKYYEWLEQSNNAIGQIESLYNSKDLDLVNNFYLNEIVKEILPNFPQNTLIDKTKFIKYVGQFYRSKGTPESVKFLFRILYDENIEIYFPKSKENIKKRLNTVIKIKSIGNATINSFAEKYLDTIWIKKDDSDTIYSEKEISIIKELNKPLYSLVDIFISISIKIDKASSSDSIVLAK